MFLKELIKSSAAIVAVGLITVPAFAQQAETTSAAEMTDKATVATSVSSEGDLGGSIFKAEGDEKVIVSEAQVSLVSQGKVIDSVKTDASGQYSFQDVQPGKYEVIGSSEGFVGSRLFDVSPYVQSQSYAPSHVTLYSRAPEVIYNSYASTPVSTFSSSPIYSYSNVGYGGGGGGGFGGGFAGRGLGGRLGGGMLRNPRSLFLIGGLVGGLAAINDSSPDN